MTKIEAKLKFDEIWRFVLSETPRLKNDIIAKREAWSCHTDALCKDGIITENQYSTWSNPY